LETEILKLILGCKPRKGQQ